MISKNILKVCAIACTILPQLAYSQSAPQDLVDAAKKGDPNMEWALGHYYLENTSDKKQAYQWLKKAAYDGQQNAKVELSANFDKSGTAPSATAEETGIAKRANEAKALVLPGAPDTRLTMFKLDIDSAPQYVFYSPIRHQQVTVVDVAGKLVATPPSPGDISLALPGTFIDLPQAVASAKAQGMEGDVKSAVLMVSQGKEKAPVAVWTLTPVNNAGRFLSYFVAADDGHKLALTDFSDGIDGTDKQLKAIQAAMQPQAQVQNAINSGGTTFRSGGFDSNAAYRQSQQKAYDYAIFQGDAGRAQNCRDHGC